jgi:hypothetical protein
MLPLSSQYIFSLLLFIVNNRDDFVSNSVYRNINTRRRGTQLGLLLRGHEEKTGEGPRDEHAR